MSPTKKPIKITLFHANWCGHCVKFMPVWEKMKEDENATKNIDFEQYEESSIKDLPDSVRIADGVDVRTKGWPTLKISVNGDEHFYEGSHKARDIYKFIIGQLGGKKT